MTDQQTTGEARIYLALPSGPESEWKHVSDQIAEWAHLLNGAARDAAVLESAGWKPKYIGPDSDGDFTEYRFSKRFADPEDAETEVERLKIGLDPVWYDD